MTTATLSAESEDVLKHLASMPGLGHSSVTKAQLWEIMLSTGGELLLAGRIYDITSKHLGAGVYRVCTKVRP